MIRITHLRKTYDQTVAVDDLSLHVTRGEIYGLLGPNGAGKTTTVNIVSGLLKETSGTVHLDGKDLSIDAKPAKKVLGVVPQELALYPELSARDNLKFWGGFYGLSKSDLSQRVEEILDAAVLYTTHIMGEAEQLCTRVGIVDHGRIIAEGTVAELKAMLGERDLLVVQGDIKKDVIAGGAEPVPGCQVVSLSEDQVILATLRGAEKLPAVIKYFESVGCSIREVALREPGLETLFIKLTGRELRE